MGKTITVYYDGLPCYPIEIQRDFSFLPESLKNLGYGKNKACIITDSNIDPLYLGEVKKLLSSVFAECISFSFPAGESSKNTDTLGKIYEYLIQNSFDRKDVLFALGGGVVGDLTGFAAATYLRGIDFVQIPTSLLAQTDSSIGGKTGVDFMQFKNMVGAFYMPKLVYMNITTLKTLPERQFSSGMAEIIKHGFIKNSAYTDFIRNHSELIAAQDYDAMEEMIYQSCLIKKEVVEEDPKEHGVRAFLNFGHTIGHAIEKLSDFTLCHGECVALGMVSAGYISYQKGKLSLEQLEDLKKMIGSYGLPVSLTNFSHTSEEILQSTKSDKKMESGKIKFILLNSLGKACMTKELTDTDILEGIQYIMGDDL
ncbi:MAG: 3-dehydroquinate synthase [Lachnospiraceae bacterium]|nr:3-dehydroquinate synthase [Lachnospiraceae bacterium]